MVASRLKILITSLLIAIGIAGCSSSNSVVVTTWYDVMVTSDTDDIRGMQEIGKISAKSNNAYWRDRRLRADLYGTAGNEAIQNIKMKAAQKGAKVVFITNRTAIRPSMLDDGRLSYKVKVEGIMYK